MYSTLMESPTKPWYIKYKWYLLAGGVIAAGLIARRRGVFASFGETDEEKKIRVAEEALMTDRLSRETDPETRIRLRAKGWRGQVPRSASAADLTEAIIDLYDRVRLLEYVNTEAYGIDADIPDEEYEEAA